jgi:hypothetical protein
VLNYFWGPGCGDGAEADSMGSEIMHSSLTLKL